FRDIVPVGEWVIIAAWNLFWYKHIDYQTGTTFGGGAKIGMTKSAHWDGPGQIADRWKGWKAIIGLLPATRAGSRIAIEQSRRTSFPPIAGPGETNYPLKNEVMFTIMCSKLA